MTPLEWIFVGMFVVYNTVILTVIAFTLEEIRSKL